MSEGIASLPRDILSRALGGDLRAVRAFEMEAQNNADIASVVASSTGATDAIQDATVIVLSPNAAFSNERVLRIGPGISAIDDGTSLTLSIDDEAAHVVGGFRLTLTAQGVTTLVAPLVGTLATLAEPETFSNKTLALPRIAGITDYADDAAAAAGGVPVTGIYMTAGALKVRRS